MIRRCKYVGQAAYGVPDNFEEVPIRIQKFKKSVADLSYFRPNAAVVRNAVNSAAKGVSDVQNYTFPDGQDDGREIPPYSRPDCDIVELTQFAEKQNSLLKEEIRKAKVAKQQEERLKSVMQDNPPAPPAQSE